MSDYNQKSQWMICKYAPTTSNMYDSTLITFLLCVLQEYLLYSNWNESIQLLT